MDKNEHLFEVKPNVFLSKSDPNYFEKYLNFHPNDRAVLCDYAKKLESEGKFKDALFYFTKASEHGSIEAKRKLRELERKKQAKLLEEKNVQLAAKKQQKSGFGKKLLTFLLLLALLLALVAGAKQLVLTKNIFKTETVAHENNSATAAADIVVEKSSVYKKDDLLFLIVLNAVERYHEERGEYPTSLNELIKINPENWLSFIPKDMVYAKTKEGYSLTYKGVEKAFGTEDLFSLAFYPKSNELALVSGEQTLAVFPVASGTSDLPFQESKVLARVVEPNGRGSALGSRGLVLQDDFAIHGTNNPNSIGEYTTEGCLRLFNPDIEILYPYISLGTPFSVKDGEPPKPMYSMSLPTLHNENIPFENETTPSKTYKWKN